MGKDIFTKQWIIDNSIEICSEYKYGVLTLRGLHYQLVGIGMTNDIQHYKRVVNAMIDARWSGDISFDQFSDLDRSMVGETEYKETVLDDMIMEGKHQIEAWMTSYSKNRWENQPIYPEILIEKKALQGVFSAPCKDFDVSLGACKGYPSLTFLNEMANRFRTIDKNIVILYFGDYDPSGEDIPRSIVENLDRLGVSVELKRIALMEDQVVEWNLPSAPAKLTDTRTAKWEGLGQVELDAVRPENLQRLCRESIQDIFDIELYRELMKVEILERSIYRRQLVEHVKTLNEE